MVSSTERASSWPMEGSWRGPNWGNSGI
jgi:hypothetical protein